MLRINPGSHRLITANQCDGACIPLQPCFLARGDELPVATKSLKVAVEFKYLAVLNLSD